MIRNTPLFVCLDVHFPHEIKGKYAGYINQDCSSLLNHNFKDYSECIIFILGDELFPMLMYMYVCVRSQRVWLQATSSWSGVNLH